MLDDNQVVARRLVGALDATDLQIVRWVCPREAPPLDRCASGGGPALYFSMMKKPSARRSADAVRIGHYAALDRRND
jgi:hypothetical protein